MMMTNDDFYEDPKNIKEPKVPHGFCKQGLWLEDGGLIPWEKIKEEMAKHGLKNKILVTFSFQYGRCNYYDEMYLLDKNEWEALKPKMLGKELQFGEIAGKHSDVCYTVTEKSITETTNFDEMKKFHDIYGICNLDADPINKFHEMDDEGQFEE